MNYRDRNIDYSDILRIILGSIIVIFIIQNPADSLECSNCHAGTGVVKALDTLATDKGTCLKCHNPDYPPQPIGYNTHLTHVGKYSAKVDYIKRHPSSGITLNCGDCHRVVIDCRECHVKDIPHIKGAKGEKLDRGEKCNECHGRIDNLFKHPDISVKIHDIFDDKTNTCKMCHNPDSMSSLQLANNEVVFINESYKLCRQCHSGFYNKWNDGDHWANKIFPKFNIEYRAGLQDYLNSWEDKWKKDNRCAKCHNPHRPNELYWIPSNKDIEGLTKIPQGSPSYTHIIGIMVLVVIICTVILIKKNKLKKGKLSLSISKLKKISLPKISLPEKISLPISVSIEEDMEQNKEKCVKKVEKIHDKVEIIKVNKDVKDDNVEDKSTEKGLTEKEGTLLQKTEKLKEIETDKKGTFKTEDKDKKFFLHRGDILFIFGIVILLSSSYIFLGNLIPIKAIPSESMSPNIEIGDWIIYKDIDRIDDIKTNKDRNSESFNNYGDVIIYKPFGKDTLTPYIHRAMYYVQGGEEMWPGGPRAHHEGYITKGDNNSQYDQQTEISPEEPVKKEWIIGIAKYRIPYIGYINMVFS